MKVMFVLDKLDMGGLQKVNVCLSGEMEKKLPTYLYSLQRKDKIYDVDLPLIYGEKNIVEVELVKVLKGINYFYRKISHKNSGIVSNFQIHNLAKSIKNAHVTHVILSGPSLLFVSKLKKIIPDLNCVMWMHSSFDIYVNSYFERDKSVFLNCVHDADGIVCLSETDRRMYTKLAKNVVCINNPLTIDSLEKKSSLLNKKISFVGTINIFTKGLDYLFEISKGLSKDWIIEVVGDGPDKKKIVPALINYPNIKFVGALEGDMLSDHYLSSSIHISTSRWEGFGLVTTEAMSFGLPIVSFLTDGSKEILVEGKFGLLIPQGDVGEFVKQLQNLINFVEKRQYWADRSLSRSKDFEIVAILDEWITFLSRLK